MNAEQAENLLLCVGSLQGKPEWNHADSILDLAIKANKEIFHIVKEENPVCEALLELMKPEMDAAVEKAVEDYWKIKEKKTCLIDMIPRSGVTGIMIPVTPSDFSLLLKALHGEGTPDSLDNHIPVSCRKII